MNDQKKLLWIDEKEIIKVLSMRTGMDEDMIHTMIYFFERTILHHVKLGYKVKINDFFVIYKLDNQVEIMLNEKVKKHMKKK